MARHIQSDAEKAYNKQIKRIRQFVRRAERRGYVFSETIIPQKPKKITQASVRRLQSITPARMYKKAEYIDYSTGELISGTKARKSEKQAQQLKALISRAQKRVQKAEQKLHQAQELHNDYGGGTNNIKSAQKSLSRAQKTLERTKQNLIKNASKISFLNTEAVTPAYSLFNETKLSTQPPEPPATGVPIPSPQETPIETPSSYVSTEVQPEPSKENVPYWDKDESEWTEADREEYYRDLDRDLEEQHKAEEQRRVNDYLEQRKREHDEFIRQDNLNVVPENNTTFETVMEAINRADPDNTGAGDMLRDALRYNIDDYGYNNVMNRLGEFTDKDWASVTVPLKYTLSGEARGTVYNDLMNMINGYPSDAKTMQALSDYAMQYDTDGVDQQVLDKPSRVIDTEPVQNNNENSAKLLEQQAGRIGRTILEGMEDSLWYDSLPPNEKAEFQIMKSKDSPDPYYVSEKWHEMKQREGETGLAEDKDYSDEYYDMSDLLDQASEVRLGDSK